MGLLCIKMTKYANSVIARPQRKNAFFKHAEIDEFTKLVIGRPRRKNAFFKHAEIDEFTKLVIGRRIGLS